MKRLALVLFAALYALGQGIDPPLAALSGVVTSKDGLPLPGAKVTLSPPPSLGSSAVADERGKYTVEGVSPGTYFVLADATGYVKQPYGGKPGYFGSYDGRPLPLSATPVVVAGSNNVSNLNIQLTRYGVISGRVTSADRNPAGEIPVYAVRWTYLDGTRKLLEKGRATTDAGGAFRMAGLAPGQYFIYAVPPADPSSKPGQPKRLRQPTFSPNALKVAEAIAVTLAPGSDGFADVRLREDALVTVRGTVIGSGTRPPNGASVLLMQDPDTPVVGGSQGAESLGQRSLTLTYRVIAIAGANGDFQMEGVMPGDHRLIAFGGNNPSLNMSTEGAQRSIGGARPPSPDDGTSGTVDLSVGSQNVDRVTILLRPGGEITSKITMDGMSYREWARQRMERSNVSAQQKARMLDQLPLVTLIPAAGVAVGGNFPVQPNGRNGLTQKVTAGRYFLEISGSNREYYVKSLRLGNQDVMRQPFDFNGGNAEMEIMLGTDFGRVTGTVANRDGNPVPGAPMSLWPAKRDYSRRDGGVITGTARHDGSFIFPLVPPGDYYVIAYEDLPDPGLAQYPDFLLQFLGKGKQVKVDPNQPTRATVETVTAGEIGRLLATLP